MAQTKIATLTLVFSLCGAALSPFIFAQHESVAVDWKAELANAKVGIEKNPKSAFWHNQAGVAYDALGDVKSAEKELTLASRLDPANPIGYYALYAFYQRRGTTAQMREALLNALDNDSANPLGRFELGVVLEKEGHLAESLREYRLAKLLVAKVKGREYVDARGNPYEIQAVRTEVDGCINRVAKLRGSKQDKD